MKNTCFFAIVLSLLSVSCSKKDAPVAENSGLGKLPAVDTTSISGFTIQFNNLDYAFALVNQWGWGAYSDFYLGAGPTIATYQDQQWPSTYPQMTLGAYFRHAQCSLPPDSFRVFNLADSTSVDTVVIHVEIRPNSLPASPVAVYSNVRSNPDTGIWWASQSTGEVRLNKYAPCPNTNPGHTYDVILTMNNLVLTLVDSAGPFADYDFPRSITVKDGYFKVLKQ